MDTGRTQRRAIKGTPRLTAVVLCYNKANEIGRFWASLKEQIRQPDQVIVVDDCSTDKSGDYYRRIVAPWPLIRLPKNKGQGHARNVGASFAKCDFIIFLDGDIQMKPTMLQKLELALIADPSCSISYSHYDRVGTRTDHVRALPYDSWSLRKQNFITMMSMVRFEDMPSPPFDESLRRYEDWDLWLRMDQAGCAGVLVPEILFSAFYKTDDLSGVGESADWYSIVRKKHGLTV